MRMVSARRARTDLRVRTQGGRVRVSVDPWCETHNESHPLEGHLVLDPLGEFLEIRKLRG